MNNKALTTQTEEVLDRDAWDQLENEPDLWFERFSQFRLLGPRRSMRKVYLICRKRDGKEHVEHAAPSNWSEKARLYHWHERAAAWDRQKIDEQEEEAERIFGEGLALPHTRVDHLKQLAKKMEDYLLDKRTTRLSPHLIEQLRGTYDDIAKELGQRVKETRITGPGGGPVEITTSWGRGGSATEAWQNATVVESTADDQKRIEGSH